MEETIQETEIKQKVRALNRAFRVISQKGATCRIPSNKVNEIIAFADSIKYEPDKSTEQ